MSEVEEINTIEKMEGDNIYEDSSIMGVNLLGGLRSGYKYEA